MKRISLNGLFLMLLTIVSSGNAWAISCPAGWTLTGANCTPLQPSGDYFSDSNDHAIAGISGRYVCGGSSSTGWRVPVLSSFEPLPISTHTFPNTTNTMSYSGGPASVPSIRNTPASGNSAEQDFTYVYSSLSRCVCYSNSSPSYDPAGANDDSSFYLPNHNALKSGASRIYPDTFDVISTQDQKASVLYNMVAYSSNASQDGRAGAVFNSGNSICGCPNVNETPVKNKTVLGDSGIIGMHCQPMVSGSGTVLTTYNPAIHDSTSAATMASADAIVATGKQIIQSPLDSAILPAWSPSSDMVPTITIPTNGGGSQQYGRKIWTCAAPYVLNASGTCQAPDLSKHVCGAGSGSGTESPVSAAVASVGGFSKVVNQKLACCMNDSLLTENVSSPVANPAAGAFVKFDCIDNSSYNYNGSFETLWAGNDSQVTSNGSANVSNALVLAGPTGSALTGFYTLSGSRCSEYSEFSSAPIVAHKLSLDTGVWKMDAGVALPYHVSDPSGKVGGPPSSISEMVRCPILVRAAMIATCPTNSDLPVVQRTYTDASAVKYCSAASSIQVHVRMEQIYEIAGTPKMQTIDTIQQQRMASSISIDQIIAQKNGNTCPAGTSKQGEVCVYN